MNKFLIPYVAVYDQDHQAHKGADAIASADTSTQKIEDEIDSDVGASIVLINDIEEELGLPARGSSKPFVALNHINAEGFTISESMTSKIRSMYDSQA
jgi:CRISPR-associated exonuclease Cas4